MVTEDEARVLLSGPRGRRLCAELVSWPGPDGSPTSFAFQAAFLRGERLQERHRRVLDELQERAPGARAGDGRALLVALADTVAWARYWQAPEDVDVALDSGRARDLLLPVAESLVERAPWLWDELVAHDQHIVLTRGEQMYSGDGHGAGAGLRRWREAALVNEAVELPRRLRPVMAAYSGTWWSTPAMADCPQSTRSVPVPEGGELPLHLLLQEDSFGETTASTLRAAVRGAARVLEIRGPADWVALVERHPLVVTRSRAHDWYRATGRVGAWAQPDWAAVAASYDAAHLTVAGYLSTAGQALDTGVETADGPVGTVLAGWDPDATWWLADGIDAVGPTRRWQRGEDTLDWHPVQAASFE